MSYINNVSIGKKLIGSFLLVAGIACIITILGYTNMALLNGEIGTIYHDSLIPIQDIGTISTDFNEIRGDMLKYALVPQARNQIRMNIAGLTVEINTKIADYKKTNLAGSERENFDGIESSSARYLGEVQSYLNLVDAGNNAQAIAMLEEGTELSRSKVAFDTYSQSLDDINIKQAESIHEEAESTFTVLSQEIVILGLLGVIISLVGGYAIARGITVPLSRTVVMIQEMGKGHLGTRLGMNRKDEIGILAETMDMFADNLQNKVVQQLKMIAAGERVQTSPPADEKDEITPALNQMILTLRALLEELATLIGEAKEGRLHGRGDSTRFFGLYREMVTGINDMLDTITIPLNETLRVAERYANVEFDARFDEKIRVNGELLLLKEKINRIGVHVGTELNTAIGEINEEISSLTSSAEEAAASVEEVTSGASAVAQSSSAVSVNVEKSVQSVEQVLSAMEELNTSVSSVAVKVESVSKISREAEVTSNTGMEQAAAAEQGIERINITVTGVGSIITEIRGQMKEIEKIVDIIGDIADQTNLLALNAAIEAARAGNAGMGFAVVANEVKKLAEESQESTKNIAEIISSLNRQSERASCAMNEANTEVEKGTASIEETIRVFHSIVDYVEEISRNMTDVASLAEEQAAAVEEVTMSVSAVKSMAEATAGEAASSAAASEESSSALAQVSAVVSDLSLIATRINDSISRLHT